MRPKIGSWQRQEARSLRRELLLEEEDGAADGEQWRQDPLTVRLVE
jgi:hypothetical protein